MSARTAGPGRATSLRTRVALLVAGLVALGLLASGVLTVASFSARERDGLDRDLVRSAESARAQLRSGPVRMGVPGAGLLPGGPRPGSPFPGGRGRDGGGSGVGPLARRPRLRPPRAERPRALADRVARAARRRGPPSSGDALRVLVGGEEVSRAGRWPDAVDPAPGAAPGTVRTRGVSWRAVARRAAPGVVVQVARPTAAVEARIAALRDRVALGGAGAVLLAALAGFLLAGAATRAVRRLDLAAASVGPDLASRLPEGTGPTEVRGLSRTLNGMLGRLARADAERSAALESARRFAADAGHELRSPLTAVGASVDVLRRHPDLPSAERAEVVEELAEEHRRVSSLVDALQTLARGDANARLEREPVDVAELVDDAVAAISRAHPDTTLRVADPLGDPVVAAWAPGLRLAIENLVRNACVHGRPGGSATVAVRASADAVEVLVDDDGQGIAADERAHVVERFARGRAARAAGSGLGLSLVEQQALLHGGALRLADAPAGGLRAVLRVARGGGSGAEPRGGSFA